jgi:hypothetical protein
MPFVQIGSGHMQPGGHLQWMGTAGQEASAVPPSPESPAAASLTPPSLAPVPAEVTPPQPRLSERRPATATSLIPILEHGPNNRTRDVGTRDSGYVCGEDT